MIFGDRIKFARELLGLTQDEFADRIGVTQSAVAHFEAGRVQPSSEVLQAITFQTPFLSSFFAETSRYAFPLGSLLFRSRRGFSARLESQTHRFAQVSFELFQKVRSRFNPLSVSIPRLNEDPIRAAQVTRSSLGLPPSDPIPFVVNAIERAGVCVLAVPVPADHQDAFSVWAGNDSATPVVTLLSGRPGDRLRWSIVHELAHLVLHRTPQGAIRELEKQADQFASEFLLPTIALDEEIQNPISLVTLAPLKQRWGVSVQALILKAKSLGKIADRDVSRLFAQLESHGWRDREPAELDVPVEKPRGFRRMIELLYGVNVDLKRASADFYCKPNFLAALIDLYAGSDSFAA
jgi:Zn-dependent peptidase ImmA (M78 family)/transcriptional regulator with XRE-family HTH domain